MLSNSILTLTIISQWTLFIGIALILFGWIEKKDLFILGAHFLFVTLGFMAIYILLTDGVATPQNTDIQLTKEMKLLTYLKGLSAFMFLSVISLLMKLFKLRFQKVIISILLILGLMLFFMVFNILQMAS